MNLEEFKFEKISQSEYLKEKQKVLNNLGIT